MIGGNYISINLSTRQVDTVLIKRSLVKDYLGGKALAARLLYDMLPPGTDPLAEDSILIINTGLMNNTGAPSSSRFNMTFKNVLTGGIASSN